MRRSVAALALAVVLPTGAVLAPAARADVVVKSGETLSEIAERHGVSLNRLMQANGIKDPTLLQVGQRLVIPGAGRPTAQAPSARGGSSVTVRSGETLSEIAERYGVSLNRLMQANGIQDPTSLQIGQRLVIPGAARAATAASAPAAAGATGFYTVKSGETLSEIAARNSTSVERLMQLNGISNANMVVAGTRLTVPMRPRPAVAKAKPANARFHVVQSGETLSHIASDYNVPVERLISLNKITDPNMVAAGTRLQLQAAPPVAKPKPKVIASKPKPKPKASDAAVARKPAATTPATASPTAMAAPAVATATAAAPAAAAATTTAAPSTSGAAATPNPAPTSQAATTKTATAAPAATPTAKATAGASSTATATSTAAPTGAQATATATATTAKSNAQPSSSKPASTQASAPAAKPKPAAASSKPAAVARKPVGPDWRTYGPMQVDWANWRAMGGSFVAPSLGRDGKPHYLAINCGARKLNATSQSGQWRTWDSPQNDYEQRLVSDLCSSKGG
ncbi:MAG: LysM peptidoglycan-binding domain-containing protein [Prochlorococcaceae cyanobacterium]